VRVAAALVDSSRRHYRLRTIAPARQAGRPRRQQATTSTSTSTMTPCPPSPSPSLSSGAASLLLKPPTLLLRLVAASTPVAGHSSAGPSSGLAQVARCRFVQGESGAARLRVLLPRVTAAFLVCLLAASCLLFSRVTAWSRAARCQRQHGACHRGARGLLAPLRSCQGEI
jgi:hypothetical protein